MRWGNDLTEVVVRYGWPVAWEQSWPSAGETSGGAVGRDPPGALRTFPPRAVLEPSLGRPAPWPRPPAGGQAAYVPPFLDSIGGLAGQIGRFWRPGGILLVAAAEVPALPGPRRERPATASATQATFDEDGAKPRPPAPAAMAGLFLVRDGEIAMEAWRTARPGAPVRLSGSAPVRGVGVVSLETWVPAMRSAHRMRVGIALPALAPGLLAMSDLALLEPPAEPRDALEAAGVLRSSAVYQGTDSIDLAFEVYGVDGSQETVSFAAWIESRGNVLARLARRLGIAGSRHVAFVEWARARTDRLRAAVSHSANPLARARPWDVSADGPSIGARKAARASHSPLHGRPTGAEAEGDFWAQPEGLTGQEMACKVPRRSSPAGSRCSANRSAPGPIAKRMPWKLKHIVKTQTWRIP